MGKSKDLIANFSEKLGFLIGSGVPLLRAFEVIIAENPDEELKECLTDVLARISRGMHFSEALEHHPDFFSPSYIGMARSGENQGILDHMMEKLANGTREGIIPVGGTPVHIDKPESPETVAEINHLLEEAVAQKASDLHLVPANEGLVALLRVDGCLREVGRYPEEARDPLVNRVKALANLNMGERYLPQDGRILLKVNGKRVDIRVNLLPVIVGEKVTMRLIPTEDVNIAPELVFPDPGDLSEFQDLIKSPFGLVVLAGPSGSGKTTTAYCALKALHAQGVDSIVTIETPASSVLEGIAQIAIRPHFGFGIPEALNAVARADPDVIFVCEVTDEGVMAKVLKLALTGHLVFITISATGIPDVFERLLDLKAPPHLLASALTGVICQRLVRMVCKRCARPVKIDPHELKALGWKGRKASPREGKGCPDCNRSGFRGRRALYEFFRAEKSFKDRLQTGDMGLVAAFLDAFQRRTMSQTAADFVASGITTLSEVRRVLT